MGYPRKLSEYHGNSESRTPIEQHYADERLEARSGVFPAVRVDLAANQQIQQLFRQHLERGNSIRATLGEFPFARTSVLSTATQIYLRQATASEWQTVQQTVNGG
ncbi:MAG TPA: hypothetical protein V6C57_23905 [Coleofasciculaceae cyanobacterium]